MIAKTRSPANIETTVLLEITQIVKSNPKTGELVYLKDVARVELGKFTFSSNSFVDGKRASFLQVYQSPGSNALQTAENVYKALEDLKKVFPQAAITVDHDLMAASRALCGDKSRGYQAFCQRSVPASRLHNGRNF